MTLESIKELLTDYRLKEIENSRPNGFEVNVQDIHSICSFLHSSQHTFFDYLSNLTGVDYGPERGQMAVVYHLFSIPFDFQLCLKVLLDRNQPTIPSVSDIWKTADWHEREAFDLFGIRFENHPDLRRILLPADWEGHPLRKDYAEQDKYHGVTVKY